MVSGTEFLILAALAKAGESYGRPLIEAVAALPNGRKLTLGTMYPTLHRLEEKGMIRARWGDESEAREGARRRYYELTADGLRALTETRDTLQAVLPSFAQPSSAVNG